MLWGFQKRAYLEGHLLESSTCCWSYQGRVALTHEVWDDFSPKTCWTQIMVPFQLWTHIIFNYSTFHTLKHLWIYEILMLPATMWTFPKKQTARWRDFSASPEDVMPFSFSGPPSPVAVGNRDVKDPIVKEFWGEMVVEMRQSSPGNCQKKYFRYSDYLDMDVRKYGYPQIIHFNRVFHYKPSIFGYLYFWKHPYR